MNGPSFYVFLVLVAGPEIAMNFTNPALAQLGFEKPSPGGTRNLFASFSAQSMDVSVQLEALDILGDLLSRFGGMMVSMFLILQTSCADVLWRL